MRPENDRQRQGVFIVADDLTGALDTAGVFASPADPMDVFLSLPTRATGHRISIDLDTRSASEAESVERLGAAFRQLRHNHSDGIFFKKIDSVLRGNPIAETMAAYRSGQFDRVLFAPAFPAMGRITRDARQHVASPQGWQVVGPPLLEAFEAFGLRAQRLTGATPVAGIDVHVADAANDAELARAVRQFPGKTRTLLVGSAGLASVLAGGVSPRIAVPPIELVVCGTNHPATLQQIETLRSHGVPVHDLASDPDLSKDGLKVLTVTDRALPSDEAAQCIGQAIRTLPDRIPKPRAAFVAGGWTLRLLAEATGADRLICMGQCSIGVPVCRVVGGRWDGVSIVSKSGGFGDPDLLWRLLQDARSGPIKRRSGAACDNDAKGWLPI